MTNDFTSVDFSIAVRDVNMSVAAIHRKGSKEPIVFLHGFGSTKEDYADITRYASFHDHPFLAYDAPGCGETQCDQLNEISIPFLVETAIKLIDLVNFEKFHLVGHSMGGLTALELANKLPERILSFVDIEGNIAPEDCFLSRQIFDYPDDDDKRFFNDFITRIRHSGSWASALYSASLRHKVRSGAVRYIFKSMVDFSDHGNLMEKFLNLPCPKMFMFGEDNSDLTYLEHIELMGVTLAKVPDCGHFPMYSNPVEMWRLIGEHQDNSIEPGK